MKVGVDVQQKAWSMCREKAKCNIFLGHDSIHINGRAQTACIFCDRIRFLENIGNGSAGFK